MSILSSKTTTIVRACSRPRKTRRKDVTAHNGTTTIIMPGTCSSLAKARVITRTTPQAQLTLHAVSRKALPIRAKPHVIAPATPRRAEQNLSPLAFVNFLQNHDQIGNRALGERLTILAPPAAVEAALTILLLSPSPPLLFMGEEWGSRQPFPFFCDFKGELADAVRNGRKREFALSCG